MSFREGPFQNIVAVGFWRPDDPENFVDGEKILIRIDCSDPNSERLAQAPQGVTRSPTTGFTQDVCICGDGVTAGIYIYQLRFSFPLTEDWPDCVIGASSGARIRALWPDEPDGWGTPTPADFANECVTSPTCEKCSGGVGISGTRVGQIYQTRFRYFGQCCGTRFPDECPSCTVDCPQFP